MTSHFDTIKSYLPWIKSPLIVNGPMATFAGPQLATAVTMAGGHGQVGSINDAASLEKQLAEVQNAVENDSRFSGMSTLPIGVGFLLFLGKLDTILPVVEKYKPAVLWMFAEQSLSDYATWAASLRAASPASKIWIQVGSVSAALHIASTAKPDVLVIQGSDAGGHGYEKGAGVISVLPETVDALSSSGFGHIPILASGGIVDGRGVAAALSLGASGVVMGTRFLSATETTVHPQFREKIFATSDGGQTTTRAKVFDELRGPNMWPVEYDGRGLVTASYRDHRDGVDIEQIRKLHAEAVKQTHSGFGDGEEGRAVIWMGTGVGLVKNQQSAKDIIEEVREGARKALGAAAARL